MTKEEWQKDCGISDEMMDRIDLIYKLFNGQKVKYIDTYKGLPINDRTFKVS